jgi:hypothetical protein
MPRQVRRNTPAITRLEDTDDLIQAFRDLWHGIERKEVNLQEARAKIALGRNILEAKKLEVMAARVGKTSFMPVSFRPVLELEGIVSSRTEE